MTPKTRIDGRMTRRVMGGAAAGAALLGAAPGITSAATPGSDPSVITDWNATAVATIVNDAGKAGAEVFCWLGFAQAAVYNAVVGITGRYDLYKWTAAGPSDASPQAAAAAAAHRVLMTYFGYLPAARARLADAYSASLAKLPDGAAKASGVRYGERAADRILELRADDGRSGSLRFAMAAAPGVWRPTPAARAPFATPWLSTMRPLLLTRHGEEIDWAAYNANPAIRNAPRNPDGTLQGAAGWPTLFRAAPPPALTSPTYATEFNEVKALGGKVSELRTPAQTETALFISAVPGPPLQAALRSLVTSRGLDISDSARLFAATDMSIADAIGASWDCKFHYGLWRPITAIQLAAEDGNAATEADPTWEPLLATPPYPDYTSGLCSIIGSATRAVTRILGTDRISISLASSATNTTRRYESAAALCQDAVDARVWSGLHFRTADVVGLEGGAKVADYALDNYFRPVAVSA